MPVSKKTKYTKVYKSGKHRDKWGITNQQKKDESYARSMRAKRPLDIRDYMMKVIDFK